MAWLKPIALLEEQLPNSSWTVIEVFRHKTQAEIYMKELRELFNNTSFRIRVKPVVHKASDLIV